MTDARVTIVTGGSGGIGREIAERLAADGQAVVITYGRDAGTAQQVVDDITGRGGRAAMVQADVADEQSVGEVFAVAEREFGGVDVVINCAGIMVLAPLAQADLAELDRMLRTNVRGTLVVSQLAAQRLRPGGALVNFSSSVVKLALPSYAGYAASKGAVEAITMVLAKELRGRDITVNTVAPGPTATPLFLDGKDPVTIDAMAKANPLERLGRPTDIAEVVSFLAGPGRWINGQNLYANGGAV
ncbi:SDR family oxidoreductase [Agilicoccus flavus]|uniref:SDR family oxidoreductase n=1 Tax=Agilicoccus flavus TaxID=2775968 RepID=UPI001CF61EDB|nr:SDR family oxidoreductase [Agilicoccus flavus]